MSRDRRDFRVRWLSGWVLGVVAVCLFAGRWAAAADPVNLVFVYGSEKDKWLQAVTKAYNDQKNQTDDHREIVVKLQPMGSGELVDELQTGDLKPSLASPASAVFLKLAGEGVLGPTRSLVKSPVVIAMWEDRANAIGWPGKSLGWKDIFDFADRKAGWGEFNHPEWGRFKFGHTHPEHSNSGLIAVVAQVYAATGKTQGLTVDDVRLPATSQLLVGIGRSVVYYGSSTGFFGDRMSENPDLLDAAVLYENMVIAHNSKPNAKRLVAIYPKEGTFMSDHPVGIVQRPWVGEAEKQAAGKYIDYLLADEQQKRAMEFGFRPGKESIAVGAPIDAQHGADPNQPASLLEVPSNEVIKACKEAWRSAKKPANVVLAIDISFSMKGKKIKDAIEGGKQLVDLLGDKDKLSILTFNSYLKWVQQDVPMGGKDNRERVKASLDQLMPNWQTKLHEAVLAALEHLSAGQPAGTSAQDISCIIVLSDGKEFDSTHPSKNLTVDDVEKSIKDNAKDHPVVIFTIGYGLKTADGQIDKSDLDESILKRIAAASGGSYKLSSPETLHQVLNDLSAFFSSRDSAGAR